MEESLRTVLASDDGLSDQVGTRIYWGRRSQFASVLPALVLTRISGARDYHMQDASGLVSSRVQVDCFAETYTEAKQTARAVVNVTNAYTGTVDGVTFQHVAISGERDYDETESGANRHLFVTSLDLLIWHTEET
jgi:hypothetical protein